MTKNVKDNISYLRLGNWRGASGVLECLAQDYDQLLKAVEHMHKSNGVDDSCDVCGLDLRHPVHTRA